MSPSRERAVVALNKIFRKGKKPKEVIEALSREDDKRERAFLMELVYGVLRHRDLLDWMLKDFVRKPSGLSFDTINNLRLAAYQLEYMRVPEWAVVNEAVDLEKARKGKDSLVNAVLRNFLRQREAAPFKDKIAVLEVDDPVISIATATSHPQWLIKRWIKRFGREGALRLANINNELPGITIRIDAPITRDYALSAISAKGVSGRKSEYSPSGIVLEDPHSFSELSDLLGFPCVVQDEAAQLVTWLLDPAEGETILDVCAAPGGKTTHIAKLVGNKGKVTAVESELQRITKLKENISRLGLDNVTVLNADMRTAFGKAPDANKFDRVLIDAPCSSLGVIRRNPDVKYRHRPRDLQRFRDIQSELIQSASRHLKAGGSMVYSTCSTEPEEGEEVIAKFLHSNADFCIIKGEYDFLRSFEQGEPGYVYYRTYPHEHGMDGFFAARLKRIA